MINSVIIVGELVKVEDNKAIVAIPPSPQYPPLNVALEVDDEVATNLRTIPLGSIVTIEGFLLNREDGQYSLGIRDFFVSAKTSEIYPGEKPVNKNFS